MFYCVRAQADVEFREQSSPSCVFDGERLDSRDEQECAAGKALTGPPAGRGVLFGVSGSGFRADPNRTAPPVRFKALSIVGCSTRHLPKGPISSVPQFPEQSLQFM